MAKVKRNWKTLRVNLTTHESIVEEHDERFMRKYLGGRAFGAFYLLKELPLNADPLSPENILVIATGVLTHTKLSGASRYSIMAKSPLTGAFGEAEAGGWWGPELVKAGFHSLIIEGKAEKPVYLFIQNGEIQVLDASSIWGMGNLETYRWIRHQHGDVRSLTIGQAGENLVRYATIVNEIRHVHGRGGLGAVMGSKLLKAIVVDGNSERTIVDEQKFKELRTWHNKYLLESFYGKYFREHGTGAGFEYQNVMGALPTRNFQQDTFDKIADISSSKIEKEHMQGHSTCYSCVMRCKPDCFLPDDPAVDPALGGPEYETMAALGSLCGIANSATLIKANALSADLGMDSISLGNSIAFAMECFEKSIVTKEDTGGLELSFGNTEAMLILINNIAHRQGFGDLLAEGTRIASQKIGGGSEDFALHVKGQELPMHDPRTKLIQALAYAVNPAGADHNTVSMDDMYSKKGAFLETAAPLGILEPVAEKELGPEKVRLYKYLSIERSLYNCLLLCIFVGVPTVPITLPKLTEITQAVTGWDVSSWELMKVGERAITLARLFNEKHGITAKQDVLPKRMSMEIASGPKHGRKVEPAELQKAVEMYYQMMGWDEKGVPTPAALADLDLVEFADISKGG